MTVSITTAIDDLRSCVNDLGKLKSTAVDEVREEVHELEVYVSYSRNFLINCDGVLENFGYALQMENTENSSELLFFENLFAVGFYGSQYLVLVFLFCLLLRIY